MRTLTGRAGSLAVTEVPEPEPGADELLVDGLAVGVCGTDREIAAGEYGWAPSGRDRLVLGHESLGQVRVAPAGSGFAAGDLVAGVVRGPDLVPCGACAHGEFDMCRNGQYTGRGIKQLDGYASQRGIVGSVPTSTTSLPAAIAKASAVRSLRHVRTGFRTHRSHCDGSSGPTDHSSADGCIAGVCRVW